MKKGAIIKLATVLPVLIICACVLIQGVSAQGVPLVISGHVTVNGAYVSGVTVSAGGSSKTTGSNGFYQLSPSVANGSSVTVTANYQGHTASGSVTQTGQGEANLDLAITYSVVTATPTATVTATPTPTATVTCTPTPTNTPTNGPYNPPGTLKAAIEGTVRYNGSPVSGAKIQAGNLNSYELSGANGHYILQNLGCGALYTVTASYNNSSLTKTVTTPYGGGSVTLDFDLGDNQTHGNLTALTTIIGKVTYNGTAAAWAVVSADNKTDVTDENGDYELADVTSNATFNVTASYNSLTKEITVTTPADGGTIVVDIEMLNSIATPVPPSGENASLWIWLLLLALIAIAIAVAYLLYNRNK